MKRHRGIHIKAHAEAQDQIQVKRGYKTGAKEQKTNTSTHLPAH